MVYKWNEFKDDFEYNLLNIENINRTKQFKFLFDFIIKYHKKLKVICWISTFKEEHYLPPLFKKT